MSTCQNCGAVISKEAAYCSNCRALADTSQAITPTGKPDASINDELNARLERALRRNELLTYAAAGLAVAIFVALIALAFL